MSALAPVTQGSTRGWDTSSPPRPAPPQPRSTRISGPQQVAWCVTQGHPVPRFPPRTMMLMRLCRPAKGEVLARGQAKKQIRGAPATSLRPNVTARTWDTGESAPGTQPLLALPGTAAKDGGELPATGLAQERQVLLLILPPAPCTTWTVPRRASVSPSAKNGSPGPYLPLRGLAGLCE